MVYPMNEKCLSVLTAPWNMLRIFSPFNPSIVEDFDQSDLEIEKNESSYPSVPLGKVISHPLF
jgi:hypothetical protein